MTFSKADVVPPSRFVSLPPLGQAVINTIANRLPVRARVIKYMSVISETAENLEAVTSSATSRSVLYSTLLT